MLAVFQPLDKTLSFLKDSKLLLVPANFNSPSEVILSGPKEEIEKAKRLCSENHVNCTELPVSNAFHSPSMKAAAVQFRNFLEGLQFDSLRLPVYSNLSALPYQQEEKIMKGQIADCLEKPVRFVEMIEAMYASGVRTFLEIGPQSILTNLVNSILTGKDFQAISMDHKNTKGITVLWRALGQLAVLGIPLNFDQLLSNYANPSVPETKESKKNKILINGANIKPKLAPLKQREVTNQLESNSANPQRNERSDSSSLISLYEQLDRSIAQAHEIYQKSAADSHKAFLHMLEQMLHELHQITSDEVHQVTSDSTLEMTNETLQKKPDTVPSPVSLIVPQQSDISQAILSIITAETGYPFDMLKMEMDMEADLGIDSIKRVEILAAMQEKFPGLPELDPVQLANLKTVQQLNDFVESTVSVKTDAIANTTEKKVSLQKTPLLDNQHYRQASHPQLKPLIGQELPGLREGLIVVIKDTKGISRHLVEKLRAKGVNVEEVDSAIKLSDKSCCIIYLGGLMDFASSRDAINANIEAFEVAKAISKKFSSSGGTFVIVQNTGGDFGLSAENSIQAWSAGLVALARTAALEWPTAFVKAIDLEGDDQKPEAIADCLAQELLLGGAEKEVGLRKDGSRLVIEDYPLSYATEEPLKITEGSVVLVTGGARGVTSWCIEAFASRYRLHFVLLGRTILENEPEYCKTAHDAAELKLKLYEHAKAQNIELSPKTLETQVTAILANREIHQTLQAIQAKGSMQTNFESLCSLAKLAISLTSCGGNS